MSGLKEYISMLYHQEHILHKREIQAEVNKNWLKLHSQFLSWTTKDHI